MTPKLLRFAYVCEFLLAVAAVFTAWPQIGGQEALELMHPAWKLGLGCGLAAVLVGMTAGLLAEDSLFRWRTARWLAAIVALLIGMGIVTYYYAQQEDSDDSDDSSTISSVKFFYFNLGSSNALQYPKVKPIRPT